MADVTAAVQQALALPAIAFDAVKHLLLCFVSPDRTELVEFDEFDATVLPANNPDPLAV